MKRSWSKIADVKHLSIRSYYGCFFKIAFCRDVARSENLEGASYNVWAKNLGGQAVRAGPKSGGAYASPASPLPTCLNILHRFL